LAGGFGVVDKITWTLGDGFSTMTLDDKYIRKRDLLYKNSKNRFYTGLLTLGYGFKEGITGIYKNPYK